MLKTLRTILTAAAFMMIVSIPVFSADDVAPASGPEEPSETEIILPKMYLEIEDLSIEEINAVIPDDTAVVLSSLELPLPELDQIEIPAEAFALTDSEAPVFLRDPDGNPMPTSSFFSEGTIGAGTSAHITGDINLYHIGEQPDFRLKYFHDSSDGFSGHEAGEGFSAREELIEAELNYTDESISADILVAYNELEDGLQSLADYFTVTRRIPSINGGIVWNISDLFKLNGSLDAYTAGFQLNAVSPLGFNIFSIAPEAGIVFGTDQYNLGLGINYNISGQNAGGSSRQQLGGNLTFNLEPADIFRMSGDAGVMWDNYSSVYYPFEIKISGTASVFEYELNGGYSAVYSDRTELWDVFPTAAGPESADTLGDIPLTKTWFAGGGFRWNLSDIVTLSAESEFSSMEDSVMPAASTLNGFSSLAAGSSTCLDAAIGMYMKLTDGFSFSLDWDGQLLQDLYWFKPQHEISAGFEFTSDKRDMGIIGDVSLSIYDQSQTWFTNDWLPALGLEAYLRLSEGFVLSISGEDIAAGLLEGGRNVWNGYLDKGAMVQAKIKISL